ncbi:MAG: TlpA disulfide reductase family protein, partial [Acidobacteriota bacterium]
PPPPSGPAIGAAVPPTPVLHLDGQGDTLAFDDADRERLVFFFTTTCPSCLDNQEAWKTLDARASDSADVIAISLDDLESTRRYRERHGLEFPMAVASDPRALATSLGVAAVPTTVRIGVDGRISGTWVGQLSDDDITAAAG